MPEKDKYRVKSEKARLLTIVSIVAGSGSFVLFLLILIPGAVYNWAGLDIYSLSMVPFALTFLFAVASLIYGVLFSSASKEEEEKALLERRKELKSAFDTTEDVRFTSGRSFENYKKYAPYVLALLGTLTITLFLILFWRYWGARMDKPQPASALHTAFVAAIFMCMSVFAGAFCIGQSREKGFRWLRPVGAWLIMGFISTLFAVFAALLNHFGYGQADYYLTKIIFIALIVLGAEFIVSFVTEFYRPRTIEEERPVFESRLLSLFTEPGGVARNIADTLDYQFGFKVSGTWIYTFIEKSLFPLLIMWLVTLWLFTCIAEVGPNELGIRERFGKIVSEEPVKSGIHLKFPWPFGQIKRFAVDKIQTVTVGPKQESKTVGKKHETPGIVLWTKQHYSEESKYLVASDEKDSELPEIGKNEEKTGDKDIHQEVTPVSFLSVSIPVQYKIKNIIQYAYLNENTPLILQNIGEMVTTQYLASVDMLKVMSSDRQKAVDDLKKLIQNEADKHKLGVEILFVNLHDAHPPVGKVSDAFQEVIGAREEKEAEILDAEAYKMEVIPEAEALAKKEELDAKAYKKEKIKVAEAVSERFKKQLLAYREMPGMYKLKTYLDFLENDCKKIRKYIMSSTIPYEIYEINLEEKTRLDLIDADLGDITSK